MSESSVSDLPQSTGGAPKGDSEKSDNQSKKGGDCFPVSFEKFARASLSPSERSEDLGNTFFRLVIGALVIGLVHTLLKCIGKPNDRRRYDYGQNDEKP
jgi:hypothetical protein